MIDDSNHLLARLNRADVALSQRVALSAVEKEEHPPRFWLAFGGAHLGDSWVWGLIAAWLWQDAAHQESPEAKSQLRAWLGTLAAVYATGATIAGYFFLRSREIAG